MIIAAVIIAFGVPVLLFRRVAWRAAMLLPTTAVLGCGLAIVRRRPGSQPSDTSTRRGMNPARRS